MTEEDFEKVRPESTRVIDLVQFADDSAIDPMYVDRAYYLAPDGADGGRRVRGDARGHEGEGRHRQAGALRPRVSRRRAPARARHRDVHAASRRRDPQHRPGRGAERGAGEGEAGGDEARASRSSRPSRGRSNLADYKDEYREGLQRIIDAKIAGEEIVAPEVEAPPKVVNLMEALQEEPRRGERGEEEAGEGGAEGGRREAQAGLVAEELFMLRDAVFRVRIGRSAAGCAAAR